MKRETLIGEIRRKKSFLCVGLDTDEKKIPAHLLDHENPVLEFNRQIIEATKDVAVCYKINTAFYEWMGAKGWDIMEQTLQYIPKDIFTIADAKRGDIGNTSSMYARAFFDTLPFDSITVNPYMGRDSVQPFLEYKDKWSILLALTSNAGSSDFQQLRTGEEALYEKVLHTTSQWGSIENTMYVVGATKAESLAAVRRIVPHHFLLVPGVGAQGGSLEQVARYGINDDIGLLVNASRAVIYAGSGEDFAEKAAAEAKKLQQEMSVYC